VGARRLGSHRACGSAGGDEDVSEGAVGRTGGTGGTGGSHCAAAKQQKQSPRHTWPNPKPHR
jgi:hypothetical protein